MDVITPSILLLCLTMPTPQGEGWPAGSKSTSRRSAPLRSPQGKPAPAAAARVTTDFPDAGPQLRGWPTGAESGKTAPAHRGVAAGLRPVFEALGFPAEMRALGGVFAQMQLTVFDHRGGVLADLKVEHWADFAVGARRDRLEFGGRPSVHRVYGRDGSTVFAEMHGLALQQLDKDAAQELAVFGLLLRFPWEFDHKDFVVSETGNITIGGARKARIRVRRRPRPGVAALVGSTMPTDRFDVICNPRSMVPESLQMSLAGGGGMVTVKLSDYFVVGGVSIPRRRTFLDADGKKVLELRVLSIEKGQRLPLKLFRPRR